MRQRRARFDARNGSIGSPKRSKGLLSRACTLGCRVIHASVTYHRVYYPTLPPSQKKKQFIGRCHPYARKSASLAVLSRMQLTLHATRPTPHGASRLVQQAMPAWSAKTRRARHCRDATVYGHTTTAMHDMSTPHSNTTSASILVRDMILRRLHPGSRVPSSIAPKLNILGRFLCASDFIPFGFDFFFAFMFVF